MHETTIEYDIAEKFNTVAIVAGGSGGHVFPAKVMGAFLEEQGTQVLYLTDARGRRFFSDTTLPKSVWTLYAAVPGLSLKKFFFFIFASLCGCIKSLFFLIKNRPDALIGFGGYVTFPALCMAVMLRIPIWLHEQNATLGRVNRLFGRFAQGIAYGLPPTKKHKESLRNIMRVSPACDHTTKNHTVVGIPLRPHIHAVPNTRLYNAPLQCSEGLFRLLVIGGSQGSVRISSYMPQALAMVTSQMRQRLVIHHQTPVCYHEALQNSYGDLGLRPTLSSFFEAIGPLMQQAHLVIARGGANTIAEIQHFYRPSILVPHPCAYNHQEWNCRALVLNQQAWMIRDNEHTPRILGNLLCTLLANPQILIRAAQSLASSHSHNVNCEQAFLSFMTSRTPQK